VSERATVAVLPFRHDDDPEIIRDPIAGWMRLVRDHDAVGSDRGEAPVWITLRYADVCAVMRDTETFSRRYTDAYSTRPSAPLVPIHLDPPEHTKYRRLLNPLLSPRMVNSLEAKVRARAVMLVDECLASGGQVEFMRDFAFRYAPVIFFGLMGMDVEGDEADRLTILVDFVLHETEATDPDGGKRRAAYAELNAIIAAVIEERRSRPQDDFVSTLVAAEIDGHPIEDVPLQQMCLLLLLAGLDTVAATLGYAMRHLARYPGHRRDLAASPEILATAVEEILRYYPIDTSIRYVTRENDTAGCPMRPGDRVVLPFVAANRDPREFEDPDRFDMRRSPNRHVGFGVGPHRCAGSHLARLELRIALEEWHRRIPDYSIAAGAETRNLVSTTVFRLDALPLVW
jgi:cytochrome P450